MRAAALAALLALGCASPVLITTQTATLNLQLRTGTTVDVKPDGSIRVRRASARGVAGELVGSAVKALTRP